VVVVVEGTRTVLPAEMVDVTVKITGAVTVTRVTIVLVDADVPV
jgi:IMP dehydrogenase/GMP reductase